MHKLIGLGVGLLALALLVASPAAGQQVVFEDAFEGAAAPEWSATTVERAPAGNQRFLGRFGPEAVSLRLRDLPEHRWVRVAFDLHVVSSWDGLSVRHGPDTFSVTAGDGRVLLLTSFAHSGEQAFPGVHGVHRAPNNAGAAAINTLGYRRGDQPADATYRLAVHFPHRGGDLELHFAAGTNSDVEDESWGLDAVRVEVADAPGAWRSPAGDVAALWEDLGSADGGVAAEAMQGLIAAGPSVADEVRARLGALPVEAGTSHLASSTIVLVASDKKGQVTLALDDPDARRAALANHVLQVLGEAAPAGAPAEAAAADALAVRVVDAATGEPLPGAGVRISTSCAAGITATMTDGRGEARIVPPAGGLQHLSVTASAPQRVAARVSWTVREPDERVTLPASVTLRLGTGQTLSGVVHDEEGRPVQGARVYLSAGYSTPAEPGQVRASFGQQATSTDAQGRWQVHNAPREAEHLSMRVTHPDFVSTPYWSSASLADLQAGTSISTLHKGVSLEGRVVDASGAPVIGANVKLGSDRFGTDRPATKSDASGAFRFPQVDEGGQVVTVQAAGFAPELVEATTPASGPVEVRLSPGRTLRGRVVDADGRPIAGVMVVSDTWRGHRSLEWRTDTDSDGRFSWDAAPADEVQYDVLKQGYMSARNLALIAGETEHVVTLERPLTVTGTVTDAATGAPIPEFRVVGGIVWESQGSDRPPHWEQHSVQTGRDGRYTRTFTEPRHGHLVRIEADGYLPAVSPMFRSGDGQVAFDAKLEAGVGLAGAVVGPTGAPAAGAEVALVLPGQNAYVQNARLRDHGSTPVRKADEQGAFEFPPEPGDFLLVAVSDAGYAEVSRDALQSAGGAVRLQPWARVEGVVMIGAEVGAGEEVVAHFNRPHRHDEPNVYHDIRGTADKAGRFAFDRVPPGSVGVSRAVSNKLNGMERVVTYTHTEHVELEPGSTATVQIGGKGRTVRGRLVPTYGDLPAFSPRESHSSITTKVSFPQPDYPEGWAAMTQEQRQAWYQEWQGSDEGKAWSQKQQEVSRQQRRYSFFVQRDGTFEVSDVEGGEYRLDVNVYRPMKPGGNRHEPVAFASHGFTVPAGVGPAHDLGQIELVVYRELQAGDAAPPLEITTLDGDAFKLGDTAEARATVLVFWGFEGFNPHAVATLNAAADRFGDRVRMLGLLYEVPGQSWGRQLEAAGVDWPHAGLAMEAYRKLMARFGPKDLPAVLLIDANGMLLDAALKPEAVGPRLEELFGRVAE